MCIVAGSYICQQQYILAITSTKANVKSMVSTLFIAQTWERNVFLLLFIFWVNWVIFLPDAKPNEVVIFIQKLSHELGIQFPTIWVVNIFETILMQVSMSIRNSRHFNDYEPSSWYSRTGNRRVCNVMAVLRAGGLTRMLYYPSWKRT